MQVTLMALTCEYRDGMVIVPMGRTPIESRTLEAKSAQEIVDAARRLQADYDQTHNAVIRLVYNGRKIAGFDAKVKPVLSSLYCHRSPVWEAL